MYGFYRVAAAAPAIKVADVEHNICRIVAAVKEADSEQAAAIVFPEMSVTGYTCGDLFMQSQLLLAAENAVGIIARETAGLKIITIIGAPLVLDNAIYNCAFVIQSGCILGIVPKLFIPNYKEFYEKRWFASGAELPTRNIDFLGTSVPFGTRLTFSHDRYFRFGVELCEDLWGVIPPSSQHCLAGAILTFNLSASNELVGKYEYRRDLVRQQSGRCISGYVYASSGVHESTQDLVFGGHLIIAGNGIMVAENRRFQRQDEIIYADLDCQRLLATRLGESSYRDSRSPAEPSFIDVKVGSVNHISELKYSSVNPQPFVPAEKESRNLRCEEIFHIQTAGLAKRFEHTDAARAVIGISGGLDSTLALLVVSETFKRLGRDPHNIVTVTMPGFGTTDRTYNNAIALCGLLGTDLREIDIKPACLQHFKDIGHDLEKHDVTYENVQARERTQMLMDIANREGGLVIGTGDLSEIALGWSTYNGDHMSMYAVNCSVPKTLIRYLIRWVADNADKKLRLTLEDIIDTPVSPELLPNRKDGEINQKTEDIIGPYELHDFFLYHMVKYGAAPDKIRYLAEIAFQDKYQPETIARILELFLRRFFTQQFKRSCIPDGPKVGTISLSPRGDWRMPTDASWNTWSKKKSP